MIEESNKTFRTPKSARTFEKVLAAAAGLFESKGFQGTTMRDIARESELGLGALYYYVRSKEEIVLLFYERVNTQVLEDFRSGAGPEFSGKDLGQAVAAFLRLKLDHLQPHRGLLRVVMREAVDPESPLCPLGPASSGTLNRSLVLFRDLVEGAGTARGEQAQQMARGLWAAHMAILGYWLHDRSPGFRATQRAIDTLADLLRWSSRLARLPGFGRLQNRILEVVSALVPPADNQTDDQALEKRNSMKAQQSRNQKKGIGERE